MAAARVGSHTPLLHGGIKQRSSSLHGEIRFGNSNPPIYMEGLSRGQAVYMGRLGSEAIRILGLLWNLHGDVHTSMECLHGSMLLTWG